MLHTPYDSDQKKTYCGPTAISAVTGVSISKIHKMIKDIRKERKFGWIATSGHYVRVKQRRGNRIAGITNSETWTVMDRLGYRVITTLEKGMTLRDFCDDQEHTGPFIIHTGHHHIAFSHGMMCDTTSKVPVPWKKFPRLKRRVKGFYQFKTKASLKGDKTL